MHAPPPRPHAPRACELRASRRAPPAARRPCRRQTAWASPRVCRRSGCAYSVSWPSPPSAARRRRPPQRTATRSPTCHPTPPLPRPRTRPCPTPTTPAPPSRRRCPPRARQSHARASAQSCRRPVSLPPRRPRAHWAPRVPRRPSRIARAHWCGRRWAWASWSWTPRRSWRPCARRPCRPMAEARGVRRGRPVSLEPPLATWAKGGRYRRR